MGARLNKYRSIKTTIDGIVFASKAEAKRYSELKILETAGYITNIRLQVKYELTPKLKHFNGKIERASYYIADFVYTSCTSWLETVEDVKGCKSTPIFVLKRKLMLEKHGITITEYRDKK
jgi:hypothetical protein